MVGDMPRPALAASAISALVVAAVACGGTNSSEFGGPPGSAPPGPAADFTTESAGPKSTLDPCVTDAKSANLEKVNLVFMYDRSGSMGDTANTPPFDPKQKWIPVGAGMKAFFADPVSKTMSASLAFFPQGGDVASNCAAPYSAPTVPLGSLNDAAKFVSAIDATQPKGGTPTLPALQGAIQYAKTVAAQKPDEKTVIVLVTDGEPGFMINGAFETGCPNNDVAHVAAAAEAAFKATPSIPTYVIGVGPALTNLNRIAAAGGTGTASMVSVSDPTKTAATFQAVLDKIRGQILSCDFALPPPPAGKLLDVDAVNVAYSSGAGESILTYSADCAGGSGWRYDNLAGPSRVQLCPATCDAARAAGDGKLTVAFGCKTKGDVR